MEQYFTIYNAAQPVTIPSQEAEAGVSLFVFSGCERADGVSSSELTSSTVPEEMYVCEVFAFRLTM